jgi:hypothetical protein
MTTTAQVGEVAMAAANGPAGQDALYESLAAEYAAPLARLARAYEATLRYQRGLLERQYHARHHSWRWWLIPMVVGGALTITSNSFEVARVQWQSVLLMMSIYSAGLWLTNLFYEADAKRIRREISALDSLSASDPIHGQ